MFGRSRHAEVVGAGLCGLTVGAALAQRGWSVRIHERSPDLRMFGAGIWLWDNGLSALEAVGAYDQAVARAQRLSAWEIKDHRLQLIRRRPAGPGDRLIVPPRADLYDALIAAARRSGAEIVTSSRATEASPDGKITMEDGTVLAADLVVAADGIRSAIREHLGLTQSFKNLGNGCIRMLIPRLPEEESEDIAREYWSGNRVFLYTPCSGDHIYLAMVCGQGDTEGRQVPLDQETWIRSFPHLEPVIRRVGTEGRWDDLETVVASRWSMGRVAITGDAAHGQPPWLGQAANLAMANGLALAEHVTYYANVEQALQAWERACRPVTDHTERWTNIYGRVVGVWPAEKEHLRSATVRAFARAPSVERMLNRAQRSRLAGMDGRVRFHEGTPAANGRNGNVAQPAPTRG